MSRRNLSPQIELLGSADFEQVDIQSSLRAADRVEARSDAILQERLACFQTEVGAVRCHTIS